MGYIIKDGMIYEQQVVETPIDPAGEEYKLQAWKDALVNDARELAEYQAKIAEIDGLAVADEHKEKLKQSVIFYSPSGIKQAMVDDQEAKVLEIRDLVKDLDKNKNGNIV